MPTTEPLTRNQRWLAALAIGALALSGSIGARRSGQASCPPNADPFQLGAPIAPLELPVVPGPDTSAATDRL